jgi:hypothetical protein
MQARYRFVVAVAPSTLVSRLRGDFEGEGIRMLEPLGSGTRATLEWSPVVNTPLVRRLTPLLRPLFAWNHRWAMRRSYERASSDQAPAESLPRHSRSPCRQ